MLLEIHFYKAIVHSLKYLVTLCNAATKITGKGKLIMKDKTTKKKVLGAHLWTVKRIFWCEFEKQLKLLAFIERPWNTVHQNFPPDKEKKYQLSLLSANAQVKYIATNESHEHSLSNLSIC